MMANISAIGEHDGQRFSMKNAHFVKVGLRFLSQAKVPFRMEIA